MVAAQAASHSGGPTIVAVPPSPPAPGSAVIASPGAPHFSPFGLPRPLAYVLSGGGPLGAIQVGMLRALEERGVRPDLVVGASAGAINGALVAMDPDNASARLVDIWAGVQRRTIFPGSLIANLATLRRHRNSVYPPTGLGHLIDIHAGDLRIEDLPVRFVAVAVDAAHGDPVLLEHGRLAPALMASAAIPGIFPPVQLDDQLLYDGGMGGNVPMRHALELGARSLVVLDCRLIQKPTQPPRTVSQAMLFGVVVLVGRQATDELRDATRRAPVVYLPGPAGDKQSPFDFSHTTRLTEDAYRMSREFLGTLTVDGPGLYGDPQVLGRDGPPERRRWLAPVPRLKQAVARGADMRDRVRAPAPS